MKEKELREKVLRLIESHVNTTNWSEEITTEIMSLIKSYCKELEKRIKECEREKSWVSNKNSKYLQDAIGKPLDQSWTPNVEMRGVRMTEIKYNSNPQKEGLHTITRMERKLLEAQLTQAKSDCEAEKRAIFRDIYSFRFAEPQHISVSGREPVIICLTQTDLNGLKAKHLGESDANK